MKIIKIENDKYILQISYDVRWVQLIIRTISGDWICGHRVPLSSSVSPEDWLLDLANNMHPEDREGRVAGFADPFLSFDWSSINEPKLHHSYYGFTRKQIVEAIKKELEQEEPEEQEEPLKEHVIDGVLYREVRG
jgi:hypothetical protein